MYRRPWKHLDNDGRSEVIRNVHGSSITAKAPVHLSPRNHIDEYFLRDSAGPGVR
jgi:hypothetical protein